MKRRAVFLDRDGTLILNRDYLSDPTQVEPVPNAPEGVAAWSRAGFLPVVITNQSGIARGLLTPGRLGAIHRRMERLFARAGARFSAIYHCPHLPEGKVAVFAKECTCRKPRPGLLARAAVQLGIDLGASVMIGDTWRDEEAGRRAGCRTYLVGRDARDVLDAFRRYSKSF